MKYEIHSDVCRPTLVGVADTFPKALARAKEIEKEWMAKAAIKKLPNYYFYPLRIEGKE